jgi:hypothetical protein
LVPFNQVVSEKLTDRGHIKTNNKRWHYLTLHYGSDELKKKRPFSVYVQGWSSTFCLILLHYTMDITLANYQYSLSEL